jgi:hypothetical protein
VLTDRFSSEIWKKRQGASRALQRGLRLALKLNRRDMQKATNSRPN